MRYRVVYTPQAEKSLEKLVGKAPHIAKDILDKIEWLAEKAEEIRHERLRGHRDFSLHCGQYRILYLWDRERGMIIIELIGKHDEVYRKLRR